MEPKLWKAIQVMFATVDASLGIQIAGPDSDSGPDAEAHPDTAPGPDTTAEMPADTESLVAARAQIREAFDNLRITLLGTLSEQESYQVLFPLVVYVDEQVQARYFGKTHLSWPLLQRELYEVDNGGELFFDTLDSILRKPQTSEFVYEVHYFCLKHGFQGKYVSDPVRINKYMDQLRKKLSVHPMEGMSILAEESGEMKYFISPAWLYGSAGLFLILVYLVLRFMF